MANTTSAIALNYGFNWITGYRLNYRTLQNTQINSLDWTRVGMWALGAGEMDGCEELWDSGLQRLLFTSEHDDPAKFRFHSGADAVIGEGSSPSSSGGDQGVDQFWTYLPPGVQPLHYHRIAYYSLFLKLLINNPPPGTPDQENASNWVDLNPVGLWRGIRCRLFDANGAMIGYGFTTNPAWQYVDVILRRKLFPEYSIDGIAGADDLPTSVRNRFDWGAIFDAANLFDTITPNGSRMFEGNFSFSQQTTLPAIRSQILTSCRSYDRERSGRIGIYVDQVRASVFTMSRKNADNFEANDAPINSAANRYIATFRDIMVPKAADIASITTPDHGNPQVTTLDSHPFAEGDRVIIGGTNSKYDGVWNVKSVPDGSVVTTLELFTKGSNYPASIGAGGKMGLSYSRFKSRSPEFNHRAHQFAKGAVGIGIPRQRNKVKIESDLMNTTYDQASRNMQYAMIRSLGPDVRPYVTPVNATVQLPPWSADAAGSGNLAIGIETGDCVTIDDTLSPDYAGDYEVLQVDLQPDTANPGESFGASPVSGNMTLTLGPYQPLALTADSNQLQAGWDIVPGSTPGNSSNYTTIPLADGIAVFFTGSDADSATVSIPSLGFSPENVLLWASPQGYIDTNGAQLHYINNCSVEQDTRKLHLIYDNGNGTTWRGDLNFAGLAWRSQNSVTITQTGEFKFVELTLLGGEKICFGMGHVAASGAVSLLSGYTASQSVLLAFPHASSDTGNNAHGVRSYVDTSLVAHHDYWDGEDHHWEGDSYVFFCGYKNNMGTVTGGLNTAPGWAYIPVGNQTLCLGGFRVIDSRVSSPALSHPPTTNLPVYTGQMPAPAGIGTTTLQVIFTPDAFQIVDHPTHGVAECLMDANLNVNTMFEDGEGNVWYGSSSGFALVCDTP